MGYNNNSSPSHGRNDSGSFSNNAESSSSGRNSLGQNNKRGNNSQYNVNSSIHSNSLNENQYIDEFEHENNDANTEPEKIYTLKDYFALAPHYFATRIPSLFNLPQTDPKTLNPFPALKQMTARNWIMFSIGFWGWTVDALDFFAVSVTVSQIAETLNVSTKDITWGITLVLMLRSVGAVIFGLSADRWGRKWVFIANCLVFVALEIGTGFVQTYQQFLGVRAIFGIAMGGMFGNAASTALEDAPEDCRGFLSGLFQEGYAFGYLLAVAFNRAFIDTPEKWRSLFWFSAGPPVLLVIARIFLPETDNFLERKRLELNAQNNSGVSKWKHFISDAAIVLKKYWLIFIYLIIVMAGFNFMSHGSQDLYPTMLEKQLHFSTDRVTVTMVVANLGAIAGGIFFGHCSEFLGRRLAICICCILGGALIYPCFFIRNSGINAGVFFLQFMVQGAWGVVPVYLAELSPPAHRALITGLAYQLGNLASSASSTIETTIGAQFPLPGVPGTYNYGLVMAIFMGCVFGYLLIVIILGTEKFHATFKTPAVVHKERLARSLAKADASASLTELDDKPTAEYQERR